MEFRFSMLKHGRGKLLEEDIMLISLAKSN